MVSYQKLPGISPKSVISFQEVYREQPEVDCEKPEAYREKPEFYGEKPEVYREQPEVYGISPRSSRISTIIENLGLFCQTNLFLKT